MERTEYYTEIRSLADSLIEDARGQKMDSEAFDEYLWESIDGHQWVIYTHQSQQVVACSDNDGYAAENWGAESIVRDGAIHWAGLAFGAMYADVQEELWRRDDFDPQDPSAVPDENAA